MRAIALFLDVHERLPEGTTAEDVAAAMESDPKAQRRHGVRYLRYWIDEEAGKLFCLSEAPSVEAAVQLHRRAHRLRADRIYRVREVEHPESAGVPAREKEGSHR